MTWPENDTAYHLIKLFDEGVVGFSAAAVPYKRREKYWKITRPESGAIFLTDDERQNEYVLVKCWEISEIFKIYEISQHLFDLHAMVAPPVFVKYSDVFWNFNKINNSIQVFTVRKFFDLGTLEDHMIRTVSTGNRYNLKLLDRWLLQILATVDWAHSNGLILMNLSAKNICVTDDGMDLRFVDYLPAGMRKEVIECVTTSLKTPKDDHILTFFEPKKWTFLTDFEATGFLMVQLSLIGHSSYAQLKALAHPCNIKKHWSTLMEAILQNHGFSWMQTLDQILGEKNSEEKTKIMEKLLIKIRNVVLQPASKMEWDSDTNLSTEREISHPEKLIQQHNLPESSVLVSFLEQAWEFFQHENQSDFARICQSMLKLVPNDRQSAFTAYHLDIIDMLLGKVERDRVVTHTLATVLAGVLYSDDVDEVACSTSFGAKLIQFIEAHIASADLVCMFSTALAQIPCPKKKTLEQRLKELPVLYRAAFTHFQDWSTFMPVLMCIIQEASNMSMISVAKTPLIPLLMLTLDSHLEFPCEIYLCLRLMRRLIQTGDLGAIMLIRFRVENLICNPVQTFVRILERHGQKMNIRREILLITVHLWSHARLFAILMEDNWLKVFAALLAVSNDKNVSRMIQQCLSDRGLVVIDHKVYRMAKEPFLSCDEYFS